MEIKADQAAAGVLHAVQFHDAVLHVAIFGQVSGCGIAHRFLYSPVHRPPAVKLRIETLTELAIAPNFRDRRLASCDGEVPRWLLLSKFLSYEV